jgi:protein gp37
MATQWIPPWRDLVDTSTGQWSGHVFFSEEHLDLPATWLRKKEVFVNDTSDTFHPSVEREWQNRIFEVMAACEQHRFLVSTKRPELARDFINARETPLSNVWLGVSCENAAALKARLAILNECKVAGKFLRLEPLLGPIALSGKMLKGIVRVYVGAEIGPVARRCDPAWIASIRAACDKAGVECYVAKSAPKRRDP